METNSETCPFISGQQFTAVDSTYKDDHNKLLWTPQIEPIELRNYQTGESIKVRGPISEMYQDCRHHVCTSTLMSLPAHADQNISASKNITDELEPKSPKYIQKEAYDFLSIYHDDKKTLEIEYKKRLEQVDMEFQQSGTYIQTTDELEYGCQLAWRNAARCINRLFWRTLKVIDRRYVTTNDEMFKEICDHIRVAYNNGTLQASCLVMNPQARLWSTQYLRYAGYEQSDGSILGDPANRELTKAAMKLGWNKPEHERTQWDLLPIIVQADPSLAPNWYELPQDLKLEIFLSHPDTKYDVAIKKLGLRWVIQPFVADKAIEIGGIFYRSVPFSGWFMETEIGRNLCDVQRRNIIPKLAALLDLDITTAANSRLNIDRLYVEINAAVLYSFEKAKISIVDHHTAAAGFMKFMKQEIAQRGNTPADWVWLVPPVSGGMSSLFHQEMFNYVLKPRILDQRDPWTYYTPFLRYEESRKMSAGNKNRRRWLIIRAACVIIRFGLKAMKQRVSVHVLYASASGTAQSYAQQMTKKLMITGYNAKLMELDSYPFQQVNRSRSIVFIITSTFGQGNAPEGGQKVEEWLQKQTNVDIGISNSLSQTNPNGDHPLHWCSYAICAIGSSAYPFFCGFGKLIDHTFQLLGAHRLAPLATCDALNHQYKTYNEWEENTIMTLKAAYPHACSPEKDARSSSFVEQQVSLNTSIRPNFIRLTFDGNSTTAIQSKQTEPFTKDNPFKAVVLKNVELTGTHNNINISSSLSTRKRKLLIPSHFTNLNTDDNRSVRLLVFDTTGLSYYPGDHVCILPENPLANVNGIILACGWKLDNKLLNAPCSLASYTHGKHQTIRQILTHFVDLTTTLRPHTLNAIATYATDSNEQRQILELGKGGQIYTDWWENAPTVKETLHQFPSIRIPLEELIQLLPQLQPRYYSISSSDRFRPNQLHITVSVVTYMTPHGIIRRGICSNYLQQTTPKLSSNGQPIQAVWQRKPSLVRLFISPNPHFRLPGQEHLSLSMTTKVVTDVPLNSPLLMFAIGSGIAPFRSFWQELQLLEGSQGRFNIERILFMGYRTENDFLYAEELKALTSKTGKTNKLITAVIPVYSRENGVNRRHVQDAMLDYESMIYSLLTEKNAVVYMCGSTRACQGIESTLASIIESCSENNLTLMQANNIIQEYKALGRIKQDMFG
ncbi:unnamed protein product [Adineta steineri]|uniref:Nitric oxide synthase n=1 Tax=Adineta steineri TaxID=433720 RepID=A0A813ZTY2_9BILA|nr:unnamed protein product [Adineta steineri]